MNKYYRYSTIIGFLAGSLLFTPSNTLAADPDEKISIDADYMHLNLVTGYSVYTGNVQITQGELKLTGDEVTLQEKNNEVERITVSGSPAHYNHVTEKGESIQAESELMVYTAGENKLVMTKNAHLKQPDHQVSSQKIVYDTEKKIVIAGEKTSSSDTGSETKQRVNITLTPQKAPIKEKK
jgi:lipopolysaccharide export system protein LptA